MSSDFPTPHKIGVHVRSDGAEDELGIPAVVYTPPLDEPGTDRDVIGWVVPASTEPAVAGHDRVAVDVVLGVPPGFVLGAHDVVDLPYGPGGQFEVVGEVRETAGNPFGWVPGGEVNLRRLDG